jgi:hypothetical protein
MHAAGGDDCPGCETRARRLEADGTKPEIWFDTIVHSWVVRLPGAGADDGPILPLEIHWFDAPLGRVCQAAADLVFAGDALCEGDRG